MGRKFEACRAAAIILFVALISFHPANIRAHAPQSPAQNNSTHKIQLPAGIPEALSRMYAGDPEGAIPALHALQKSDPENPLGYILEGEARWWKIYCDASEVKWGMVDAWQRQKLPGDEDYFALVDTGIEKADAQLKKQDSAEMHLLAGIGWALKARLYALRYDKRATAHAGVTARQEFLRSIELDPNLADAYTGLGLYNYYVDTLSSFVKMLRFFMGIPGGSKEEGVRQIERGMNEGQLTSVGARFYLAKNLRTYDHNYQKALEIAQPLVAQYPNNPVFLMFVGNLHEELGHKAEAAATFQKAESLKLKDSDCMARVKNNAREIEAPRH